MRVILLGVGRRASMVREAERLHDEIEQHAEIVLSDFTGEADLSGVEADVVVVLGGDGSILRAAHQMGDRQLPVIAVNLGRLGFLADLSPGEAGRFAREPLAGGPRGGRAPDVRLPCAREQRRCWRAGSA